MKRILQAMDGVATKPVAGVDSMARFLRVVKEASVEYLPPDPEVSAQLRAQATASMDADGPKHQANAFIRFSSGMYDQSTLPKTMVIKPGVTLPVKFNPIKNMDSDVLNNAIAANKLLPPDLQYSSSELSQVVGQNAIQETTPTPEVKIPAIPKLPPEDGEPNPGEMVSTNQDGTRSYSGAFGTFRYDASGKAIKYTTPSFNGLGKTVDLTNNQTTQNFNQGPMNVSQTTDAKGNVVSSNTEYDLGVGKMAMGKDANGITSKEYTPVANEFDVSPKDLYAMGNKDKEATYNRAMAQVNKAPVQENNLSKFLAIVKQNDVSILNEGANPHKVSLPVQMAMQHYQQPSNTPARTVGRTSTFGKYFHKVETEVNEAVAEEQAHKRQLINQYAAVIAERVLMKESLDEACWKNYKQVGMKKKGRKMVPNCVPKESIEENEISGHSMGFKPGPGSPGIMANEAPIAMDPSEPNNPTIHGHEKANAMTLKGRIMSARAQLRELAQLAERDDLLAWEEICRKSKGGMFMGLEQNLEQIRHGIEQLAAKRRKGGVASRGIDKHIGEAVTPTIKPANPKTIKPKTKTSTCRSGQTQTGVQTKDGKVVPKCSVVKKGF